MYSSLSNVFSLSIWLQVSKKAHFTSEVVTIYHHCWALSKEGEIYTTKQNGPTDNKGEWSYFSFKSTASLSHHILSHLHHLPSMTSLSQFTAQGTFKHIPEQTPKDWVNWVWHFKSTGKDGSEWRSAMATDICQWGRNVSRYDWRKGPKPTRLGRPGKFWFGNCPSARAQGHGNQWYLVLFEWNEHPIWGNAIRGRITWHKKNPVL